MQIKVKRVTGTSKAGNSFDGVNLHFDDQVLGPAKPTQEVWLGMAAGFKELRDDLTAKVQTALETLEIEDAEKSAKEIVGSTRFNGLAESLRKHVIAVEQSRPRAKVSVVSEDDI